jgi:hypothetical protein
MNTQPASAVQYALGLDLGQAHDPSALALLEQSRPAPTAEASYACRHLHRWQLGTPYPQIVKDVATIAGRLPYCTLAVDGTGCGRAVVDLFWQAALANVSIVPVLITAGHAVSQDEHGYWHVAKTQLVSVVQVLLQARRLKVAPALPLAPLAITELSNFKAKITPAGSETFSADWREGQHDDLCLAIALAAWAGEERMGGPWTVPEDRAGRGLMVDAPPGVFLE